ncbi:hypothetical protein [Nitriliruptor alkaliphilus]|uniref:hypothetical protein n=1 Tax=Nitriliruptor alkaliphilus TaxID=427918 RepID=UPI0012EE96A2|nr:hypothetical protein [Nitriliruptor alkaliphilus]
MAALVLGLTSNPGPAQVNDTRAAAYASWSLGTQGSTALPEPWPASRNYWGVEAPDGRVHVNRFPGVAFWATPTYALVDRVTSDTAPAHPFLIDLRPAAWTAAVTVALAGLVAYSLLRQVVGRGVAGIAAGTLVFGTGLWSLAADALWPHGPSALLLLVALWGWQRGAQNGATPVAAAAVGVAAFGVVLVRPHLVVVLVVLAGYIVRRERERDRWPIAATLVGGGAAGLLALSAYTAVTFGRFTPTAGYDAGAHLGGLADRSVVRTVLDLGLAIGGLPRGLLLFTPVAAVAIVAVVVALVTDRQELPGWTVASAVAGLIYLVVQVRAVGPYGGRDFFGPRTSLETLVLAAPLLTVAASQLAARSRVYLAVLAVAAVASVAINAYGAIARSISPAEVERWERIAVTVERDFGHLDLGDVDLREPADGN